MLTLLQRVEVESAFVRDDQLTVEDNAVGQLFEQRFAQLREVAQQRLVVPALQIEIVAVAEHDAAEAVPLRFVGDFARRRQLTRQLREHRVERWMQRQRHRWCPLFSLSVSTARSSGIVPIAGGAVLPVRRSRSRRP
jgi:hypothetical protein